MLKRCMTTNNIKIAEDNARQQFTQFLRSMGYKKIRVDISTKENKHLALRPNSLKTKHKARFKDNKSNYGIRRTNTTH